MDNYLAMQVFFVPQRFSIGGREDLRMRHWELGELKIRNL